MKQTLYIITRRDFIVAMIITGLLCWYAYRLGVSVDPARDSDNIENFNQ